MNADFDQDAFAAAVDLVGRSGARQFESGYVHDDVPVEEAGWYAQAVFRGARLIEQDFPGPVEAAEALARRILRGAKCRRCGEQIRLAGPEGEKGCRWTRTGPSWTPGCGKEIDHSIQVQT